MIEWIISPANLCSRSRKIPRFFFPSLPDAEKLPLSNPLLRLHCRFNEIEVLSASKREEKTMTKRMRERERESERTFRNTTSRNSEYVFAGSDIFLIRSSHRQISFELLFRADKSPGWKQVSARKRTKKNIL